MDKFASYAAIDMMEAYYKVRTPYSTAARVNLSPANREQVTLKKVVDDISVLAIKECQIQKLPNLFMSETVFCLDDTVIERIADESEESRAERELCSTKLRILEAGLRDLSRLNSHPRKTGRSPNLSYRGHLAQS